MKSIGLAPNPHKIESVQLAGELASWLGERGVRVLLAEDIAYNLHKPALAASEEQVAGADMLVVLGGDGTMLRWNRLAAPKGTPMLGVNFGQYGFITEIHPQQIRISLEKVLDGDYTISERVMLKAVVTKSGRQTGTYYGLNDVVVSKGTIARMLGLHTFVNGKFIVTYMADGIIVASPTGSTAYSLSAGGPVIHPDVCVLIVTPICPHTLNARSLVVPDGETVRIAGACREGEVEMVLMLDGQIHENMTCHDQVEVSKAEFSAKLVQFDQKSFYDKLQMRLRWGERFES